MDHQSGKAQKGEIAFRRGLFRQQVEGERVFGDEYDGPAISRILAERMRKTLADISLLRSIGVPVSPYLEIGAERCQRSMVLENDLGAEGIAADISYDMLRSCGHYMEVFGKRRSPLRVCCDANRLPFISGSLPFVFCYQTLHHFPDPGPVTAEVMRVLAPGGYFAIEEEPFRKILHLGLYKGRKIHAAPSVYGRLAGLLDFFFSKINCNETDYGVIENDNIPLGAWKRALAGFAEKRMTLRTIRGVETELFAPRSPMKFFFAWLFGGGIRGLCRKSGVPTGSYAPVSESLACPVCRERGVETRLRGNGGFFSCRSCASSFPVEDGVLFLFSDEKFKELYPEVFLKARSGG